MPERSSRSVQETRDRESWLGPFLAPDPESKRKLGRALHMAALARGVLEQVQPPAGAEERSLERAHDVLTARRQPAAAPAVNPRRAPWLVRFSGAMRFVFTLGRRR